MSKCNILFPSGFPNYGHIDSDGCIKDDYHHDSHLFIDQDGNHVEWEDDYDCNCGCWDNSDYEDNVCKTFNVIKKQHS